MGRLWKKIGGLSRNRLTERRCSIICEGLAHRNSYYTWPRSYAKKQGLTSSNLRSDIRSMNSVDLGIPGRGRLRAGTAVSFSSSDRKRNHLQPGSVLSAVTVSA